VECLYCKKRLGMFASKKSPFCSELHEVAYHDEQAGLALRRVMDPSFANSDPPPPLRLTAPEHSSRGVAEFGLKGLPLRLASTPAPPLCSFDFNGSRPEPVSPKLGGLRAKAPPVSDSALEAEPFAAGAVQLPTLGEGVLPFDLESQPLEPGPPDSAPNSEFPDLTEAVTEAEAVAEAEMLAEAEVWAEADMDGDAELASFRLHPGVAASKHVAIEQNNVSTAATDSAALPLDFPSAVPQAGRRPEIDLALAGKVTPELSLAPLASLGGIELPVSSAISQHRRVAPLVGDDASFAKARIEARFDAASLALSAGES